MADSPNDDTPLEGVDVHFLRSEAVGAEFKINVAVCDPAPHTGVSVEPDTPRPVIFVSDGNGYTGAAVDAVRVMQLSAHIPPVVVVGVGYRSQGLVETIPARTRDLTPTVDERAANADPPRPTGGGPNFLRFLVDELQPWVAERYPADLSDTTFVGLSYGGLFATHVLQNEPSAFRRYVIGSPSLWWQQEAMLLELEHRAPSGPAGTKVFVGVGEHETQEGRMREASLLPEAQRAALERREIDMVDEARRLADVLGGCDWVDLEFQVFPDEFHITVLGVLMSRGLRSVFGAPR